MKCDETETKGMVIFCQRMTYAIKGSVWFLFPSVSQVNRELKKLLVASVGDDLQYHFERLAREKNQLILENEALGRSLSHTTEQLERMSIQCDVWRSKFLASR